MTARASRIALIVASVPDEVMRTISTLGMRSQTASASRTSPSVGAPKLVPLRAAAVTASTTSGWAWPRISGPQEETQSTYSWSSTSQISGPAPPAMKIGSRPIERIARTGELTPPGRTFSARSYSSDDRVVSAVLLTRRRARAPSRGART